MGVPVVTVTSGGKALPTTVEVLSVEVRRELNRVPEAQLVIHDGNIALRKFALSNEAFFEPGKKIVIALRYEGTTQDVTVFDGLAVRHAVETRMEGTVLRVELRDASYKLTRKRKSAVFRGKTDKEVIQKLVDDSKLGVGHIEETKITHAELVQYNATDWDFIVSRADALGMVVDVHAGAVSLQPMFVDAEPKVAVRYGLTDGVGFELELDGAEQWGAMTGLGWDAPKKEPTAPAQATKPEVKGGNLDAGAIAKSLGGDTLTLLHDAPFEKDELKTWATSRLLRSRLAFLRGRVTMPGRTDVAPTHLIELDGISDRFNGKALVSGVTQRLDGDGWVTELQLGLSAECFARRPDIADIPAGGLVPSIQGLHIGVVAAFEEDKSGEHRVKVALTALDKKQGPVWARVAHPGAGDKRGVTFWPEEGDEVVVGFLDGDPRQAIVLGAMHGSKNAPPQFVGPPSDKNTKRALVTKAGAVIGFDDQKKSVTIRTPGEKNRIVIDDDAKSIVIADQHGNEVTLDSKGITLKSAKDFTIDAASGKVVIKGSTVDVQ